VGNPSATRVANAANKLTTRVATLCGNFLKVPARTVEFLAQIQINKRQIRPIGSVVRVAIVLRNKSNNQITQKARARSDLNPIYEEELKSFPSGVASY
jgi:hypothetical protein